MKTIGLTLFYDTELLIVIFRILLVSALIWVFFRFAPVRWKREKLPPRTKTFIRVSRRKPVWTKRDWFYVYLITAAYAVVSLHRLGSTVFPTTTWQPSATPQSVILHFTEASHFDAVYAIYEGGYISTMADGTLSPMGELSRGDAAKFFAKILDGKNADE